MNFYICLLGKTPYYRENVAKISDKSKMIMMIMRLITVTGIN